MNPDISSNTFIAGQRWASSLEPELGLGIVESIGEQSVDIFFPACEETRRYSLDTPPLYRVNFQAGCTIQCDDTTEFIIKRVSESGGLLTYHGDDKVLLEQDLHSGMSDRGPEERLLRGQTSDNALFDLRLTAMNMIFHWRKSPVRGLFGGKIDLIPHQMYVAHEVSNRQLPRVLLADEVGLGKTIEACLILNRMLVCGRANRILIILPDSLVNQWFVELLRRFNHWFSIFDEERCVAIEAAQTDFNPFEDDQLIIASIDWLAESGKRTKQVTQAPWDLLIVDEAHHLQYHPDKPSAQYQLVEALGQRAGSLLLLTATPQQLGLQSHFARLRLLDPNRFSDFEVFKEETANYEPVAKLCQKIIANEDLRKSELDQFPATNAILAKVNSELANGKKLTKSTRADLIRDIADRHGTGRVLFRNTRKTIRGFPKRLAKLRPLGFGATDQDSENNRAEFDFDIGLTKKEPKYNFADDQRIVWLVSLLRKNADEKFLLICRSKNKACAVEDAVRCKINLKTAIFHEELTLIQRDRNAAWFAEADGAKLLICSEIGSEGRNFQFCRHLVFFDLPLNPELIEQRIGRLDRIGQKNDIIIHMPYHKLGNREILAKWLHFGLNAIEESILGGQTIFKEYEERLYRAFSGSTGKLEQLISDTAESRKKLKVKLQDGMDQLLEINSHSSAVSSDLIQQIQYGEKSVELEDFTLKLFDFMGLGIDDIAPHTYRITNAHRLPINFPNNRDGVISLTFDRTRAVSREDLVYVSWDHPIMSACVEQLLGSNDGTSVFAHWDTNSAPSLLIESIFILECLAPSKLNADRFLPPTPIRVVINHHGKPELNTDGRFISLPKEMKNGPAHLIPEFGQLNKLIPPMVETGEQLASEQATELKQHTVADMRKKLSAEINRLETLAKINMNIRLGEISLLKEERKKLEQCLGQARSRLDSIRLIWKGSMERLQN